MSVRLLSTLLLDSSPWAPSLPSVFEDSCPQALFSSSSVVEVPATGKYVITLYFLRTQILFQLALTEWGVHQIPETIDYHLHVLTGTLFLLGLHLMIVVDFSGSCLLAVNNRHW